MNFFSLPFRDQNEQLKMFMNSFDWQMRSDVLSFGTNSVTAVHTYYMDIRHTRTHTHTDTCRDHQMFFRFFLLLLFFFSSLHFFYYFFNLIRSIACICSLNHFANCPKYYSFHINFRFLNSFFTFYIILETGKLHKIHR